MFRAHLNAAGSDEPTNPPLVFLDQTLIVFDVEQRKNASQILHLKRMPKIGLVSYRFQTNAPTRYIVNPNCGILSDDNPIPIKIELVGNRFNPQHKLILQAALIENKDDWQRSLLLSTVEQRLDDRAERVDLSNHRLAEFQRIARLYFTMQRTPGIFINKLSNMQD
ncbi:hypothetical protein COOONC_11124 [Cooperia oncophora]